MGLGKKIVDVLQQAKAIKKVEEVAKSTPAAKADNKLPMSKRRTRSLQKQSQLNNQTTLLGG
jgi:hypothetical protein